MGNPLPTAAPRSGDLTTRARTTVARAPEPLRAAESLVRARAPGARQDRDSGGPGDAQAATLGHMAGMRMLQPALALGPVNDPFEREAERTADAVMAHAAPPIGRGGIAASLSRVQRATGKGESETKKDDDEKKRVQKSPSPTSQGPDAVPTQVEGQIRTMSSGGQPLGEGTRAFFEPRFGADLGGVRVHTGSTAASAANSLGARAFTVGEHVFFGAGQYQPDSPAGQHLLAHELTHTLQQVPARVQRASLLDSFNPKALALAKVQEWADKLPPYELLTVLLGRDPITDKQVERTPRNWVHAALTLVPDGMAIFDDLEKNGTIEKTAAWFDVEVAKLNLSWEEIKGLFSQAWVTVNLANAVINPAEEWAKVKAIFGPTLKRVTSFATVVGGKILAYIKTAVLGKLGAWAKQQKGYPLLTLVLGKDPVTDEVVEPTANGFAKAILALVPGGDKIYENLEKTKTIERTYTWLKGEIKKLGLTWDKIKEIFTKAWDAFAVADLLKPLALIDKLADIFVPPAKRMIAFAIAVGKKVLEFIFEGAMMIAGPIGMQIVGIVRKVGDTFNKIVEDPIAFVGHLVDAVKLGFRQFGKNIGVHLKAGIISWLVSALEGAGLVLPKVWDLKGILSLTVQILGITYAKMRVKLVRVLGEKTVQRLETAFEVVKMLITEGPAAAWQKIVEAIGSLWDMVIGGIKEWAVGKIVTAAIAKLVTMFNPAGAVIQSIIAIYNTVAFFLEKINQIMALVESVVDSIANIAAGKIGQAANYVEKTMVRTIPVVLGFLARFVGLGDVSGAIMKVIAAIQAAVDRGIDKAIDWIVSKAKSLFGKKDDQSADDLPKTKFTDGEEGHTISVRKVGKNLVTIVSSDPMILDGYIEAVGKVVAEPARGIFVAEATEIAKKMKALHDELAGDDSLDRPQKLADLEQEQVELAAVIKKALGTVSSEEIKKLAIKWYGLEGVVNTYRAMPEATGDDLEGDHQPQKAIVWYASQVRDKEGQQIFKEVKVESGEVFKETRLASEVATSSEVRGGWAINLSKSRHKRGRTHGTSKVKKRNADDAKGEIDFFARSNLKVPRKREEILSVLQIEKERDATYMRDLVVSENSAVFADLTAFYKDKSKLAIGELRTRILNGEEIIRSKNLQEWA